MTTETPQPYPTPADPYPTPHDPQHDLPTPTASTQTYTPPPAEAARDPRVTPTPPQIEAEGDETIDVTWQGRLGVETFTIPAAADDWPIDVALAFEQARGAVAVLGLIGQSRWSKLAAKGYKTRDLQDLSAVILRQYGLGDSGE